MASADEGFEVLPFPRIRELAIDLLREGQRKHMIHALIEADVTDARLVLRAYGVRSGTKPSFTAFIVGCLAHAIDEDRQVQAMRWGSSRLMVFDSVDVNTMVEREIGGASMGTPNIIRSANRKTYWQIHEEIRVAQQGRVESLPGMEWFARAPAVARLPRMIRMVAWRILASDPRRLKQFAGTAGVTSVGMFGSGAGWGMTIPFLSPTVVVGSIVQRPRMLPSGNLETKGVPLHHCQC